jgi:amidase
MKALRPLLIGACVLMMAMLSGCAKPAPAAAPASPPSSPHFDLEEATVADLQHRMETGQDTSRSLVDKYLARISEIDAAGPALHSVIEVNPDARSIADALDAERKSKGPRGPLHGIPVLIKDNIATADKMMTTAGSLALEGVTPPDDAFVVKQLRAAGAVILGKTNLSEWANFRSTHSTSGWSGRGGQTKNPYALDRNPSGSSSGSGAAIAASLATIAVGTETDGSITSPANNNGLVGIKPTLGLVSRFGIIPIAHSQDTAGPMARTVTDAAILLGVLAGADANDGITADAPKKGLADYAKTLDANGLKGARIGVVRAKLMGYHPATDALINAAIADLKRLGAVIVDPADIPHVGEYDGTELDVLEYEFKTDLAKYFAWLGPKSPVKSLDDLAAFDTAHADRELQIFGQEIVESSAKRGPLTDARYTEALARNRRLAGVEGIDAVMNRLKLDALIAPTGAPAWVTDPVSGDHYLGSATTPAAVAGYPHITVPAGQVTGLPVGLSFFGRAWSEATLIKFAYAYEQATHHRAPPTFQATIK